MTQALTLFMVLLSATFLFFFETNLEQTIDGMSKVEKRLFICKITRLPGLITNKQKFIVFSNKTKIYLAKNLKDIRPR